MMTTMKKYPMTKSNGESLFFFPFSFFPRYLHIPRVIQDRNRLVLLISPFSFYTLVVFIFPHCVLSF